MNRIGTLFQIGLRDPWYRANLLLRAVVLVWVFTRGTALLGDSEYYLDSMRSVWNGSWGGATFRAPLYSWFLAAVGGPIPASSLVSVAIWLVGVDLSRRCGRLISILWLFDPVLLVLGVAVMSDALFALFVYASVLAFRRFLDAPVPRNAALVGTVMGATILTRPIGIPYAILMAIFMMVPANAVRARGVLIAGVIALFLVLPRLYWNSRHDAGWTVAAQGQTFQMAVAAAVEYSGTGINYTATENRWIAEHAEAPRDSKLIRETLVRKFSVWVKLSIKGVLRTLFGHVNVETGTFAVGHPIVGPGWFSEGNPGTPWNGSERTAWVFGLVSAFAYAAFEYFCLARGIFSGSPRLTSWNLWIVFAVAGFVIAPQLFGDCRFRLPVLAVLFAARAIKNREWDQSPS